MIIKQFEMIKNYEQYINEDIMSKTIIAPKEFTIYNLKKRYPGLNIIITDFNVVIEFDGTIILDNYFYEALHKDSINKDDIVFENCEIIILNEVNEFTKVSDYGGFGDDIKDFRCSYCENLTSLDGAPKEVGNDFYCYNCENLTSLHGAPKEVGGDFNCSRCHKLTSLDGAPEKVTGDFNCSFCYNLTSIKGSPKKVGNDFVCSFCNNLKNFDDAPDIGGYFFCGDCDPNFIQQAEEKYGKDKVRGK